jgi:hypothetical protein
MLLLQPSFFRVSNTCQGPILLLLLLLLLLLQLMLFARMLLLPIGTSGGAYCLHLLLWLGASRRWVLLQSSWLVAVAG